jgi:hypothetical protein
MEPGGALGEGQTAEGALTVPHQALLPAILLCLFLFSRCSAGALSSVWAAHDMMRCEGRRRNTSSPDPHESSMHHPSHHVHVQFQWAAPRPNSKQLACHLRRPSNPDLAKNIAQRCLPGKVFGSLYLAKRERGELVIRLSYVLSCLPPAAASLPC